jgi:hypothetical protein
VSPQVLIELANFWKFIFVLAIQLATLAAFSLVMRAEDLLDFAGVTASGIPTGLLGSGSPSGSGRTMTPTILSTDSIPVQSADALENELVLAASRLNPAEVLLGITSTILLVLPPIYDFSRANSSGPSFTMALGVGMLHVLTLFFVRNLRVKLFLWMKPPQLKAFFRRLLPRKCLLFALHGFFFWYALMECTNAPPITLSLRAEYGITQTLDTGPCGVINRSYFASHCELVPDFPTLSLDCNDTFSYDVYKSALDACNAVTATHKLNGRLDSVVMLLWNVELLALLWTMKQVAGVSVAKDWVDTLASYCSYVALWCCPIYVYYLFIPAGIYVTGGTMMDHTEFRRSWLAFNGSMWLLAFLLYNIGDICKQLRALRALVGH